MVSEKRVLKGTRELVADIFAAHPDWNASQIHGRYVQMLGDPSRGVSLNAIQKHLEGMKAKVQTEEFKAKERLWHSGLLSDYPYISAEAVSCILEVQKLKGVETVGTFVRHGITVREALWVSRLYDAVVGHWHTKRADKVHRVALTYAIYEIVCTLAGKEFNTWELDMALRAGEKAFTQTLKRLMLTNERNNTVKALTQMRMAEEQIKDVEREEVKL